MTGHKDIANAINSYFTSIASSLLANSNEIESEFAPDEAPLNIEPFKFTIRNVNEVSKAIEDLNQAKATGPDGIPVRALKMAAPNISRSLTHLFNESLSTGKFPSAWKTAKVTPLFKGGTATDCNNYRPISVLPCISKILESFANSDLQNFAFNSGLIDHHQFAYSKFSLTTVALLKVVDSWKRAIDNGFKSVSVFLDLRKAFDVIKHEVLLTRLESHGVKESELRWFNSYLSERLQYVVYKGTNSVPMRLCFGVPQGSVLGPTLFSIHINNISKACHTSTLSLYADDTEIHSSSKNIDSAVDNVNKDLQSVRQWFCKNGLICNVKKSEAMIIASHKALKTNRDINIFYGDSILKQQTHFKYLGVVVGESLSWNNHMSYIASRVYPKLKLLNRISSFLSPAILLKIYKMTILPILDYGCIVWGLCSKKNSDFLERLQSKAMRIILRTNHLTCTQSMRERLGLLTLLSRRRYLRLQLVYKIVNDYHCPRQLQGYFLLRSEIRRKTLRDSGELHLPRYKTAMGQSTFEYAAAKEWNDLPKELRACKRLALFKLRIFKFLIELDMTQHICSV